MPARKRTRRDVEAEDREMAAALAESARLHRASRRSQRGGKDVDADVEDSGEEGDVEMRDEDEAEVEDVPEKKDAPELSKLDRLRNMWEFASLMQYIGIFGAAIRLDEDITIESLEAECLQEGPSSKLMEIGLSMLKCVSSHRGLTPEIFDEYVRRQYRSKSKDANPFGEEEEPLKFNEFDTFTKIRVLRQLAVWTLHNPDRLRERMYETETEQTEWRLESIGEDAKHRQYYLFYDDRLYRLTPAQLPIPEAPAWKPKTNTKKAKAAARASRRAATAQARQESEAAEELPAAKPAEEDNGLGGNKWECLAVSLDDFKVILDQFRRSRNANEKGLYANLAETVLPIIEKADAKRKQEELRKEKELRELQMLANAKRSSRIAGKMEREKQELEEKEQREKERMELLEKRKEESQQLKLERARENRILSREQRIQEREQRRIENETALENLSKEGVDDGTERKSARHLQSEIDRIKSELEETSTNTEDWFFDCSGCGVYGENWDDGTHSVACEKCNVWQHSACLGISVEDAEREDFHFVCKRCKQVEADAKKAAESPKLTIKIRMKDLHDKSNGTVNGVGHKQQLQPKKESIIKASSTATNGTEKSTPPTVFHNQTVGMSPQQPAWQHQFQQQQQQQHRVTNGNSPQHPQQPASFQWKVPQSPNSMATSKKVPLAPSPATATPQQQHQQYQLQQQQRKVAGSPTLHNWAAPTLLPAGKQPQVPAAGYQNGINPSQQRLQGSNAVQPLPNAAPTSVSPRPPHPPATKHSPYLQQPEPQSLGSHVETQPIATLQTVQIPGSASSLPGSSFAGSPDANTNKNNFGSSTLTPTGSTATTNTNTNPNDYQKLPGSLGQSNGESSLLPASLVASREEVRPYSQQQSQEAIVPMPQAPPPLQHKVHVHNGEAGVGVQQTSSEDVVGSSSGVVANTNKQQEDAHVSSSVNNGI